jgi:hypothetical protein
MEGHKNHQRRGGHQKLQSLPDLCDTALQILFQEHQKTKIPQEDVLSAGHRGRGRKASTGAPTARRLFVSHCASGSTTQSRICPICENNEVLGAPRNFKFTEEHLVL